MPKNLDGIKKLSSDEVKKYRKIVLNFIGEKETAGGKIISNANQTASASKKVDGIKISNAIALKLDNLGKSNVNKIEKSQRTSESDRLNEAVRRQAEARQRIKDEEKRYLLNKEKAGKERLFREREKIRLEQERIKQEKLNQAEAARLMREQAERERRAAVASLRQEELKHKETARQAELDAEAKAKAEEIKKREEKIRLAEQRRVEAERIKENQRLEKIKRREEIERIKQEVKIAKQIAKEKRRIKREKALKKFKKDLSLKINEFFLKARRNLAYIILYIITLAAVFYLVFCLIVLRLDFKSDLIKTAADYLPVPAVITNRGIIYYNDFSSIKDRKFTDLNYKGEKDNLIKWALLSKLAKKFGLAPAAAEAEIAVKFVMNDEFNQVGRFRIKKIKDLLTNGGEIEYLSKYADDYNKGAYYTADKLAEKFGPSVQNLAKGQISEVLPLADGYYIIQRIGDKDGMIGVKSIFIGARTVEQYLKAQLADAKVFILAN